MINIIQSVPIQLNKPEIASKELLSLRMINIIYIKYIHHK